MKHDTSRLDWLSRRMNETDRAIGALYEQRRALLDEFHAERDRVYDSTPRERYESPLGDRRERSVTCQECRKVQTWALDGICPDCWEQRQQVAS